MEMRVKHAPPTLCKLRRKLFGASPSAKFGQCLEGVRTMRKACEGCTSNVYELMMEGALEGMRRAAPARISIHTRLATPCNSAQLIADEFRILVDAMQGMTANQAREAFKLPPVVDHLQIGNLRIEQRGDHMHIGTKEADT